MDNPAALDCPSIADLMVEADATDPLPGKLLEAIWSKSRLKEITIVLHNREDLKVQYREKMFVPQNYTLYR